MANHASTDLNSKTLMFTCNMKNDIIIIIIMIIFTIIININIIVGSGSSSTCIYINMYFPTCAQCSKVVRCLRTDVSKQFKNNPASYKNNAKLILKSSKI